MNNNKKIVFISIYCALALVLDYIKSFIPFLNMPSGGSINISLIPIVVCSFHLGVGDGVICGLLWWLVSSILGLNPYFISVFQYFFDYIIPSGIIGISSIFYSNKKIIEIELGIIFMMFIRTFCIVLSGALFWSGSSSTTSFEAWNISIIYNLPYSFITTIVLLIVVPTIIHSLKKYML